MFGKKKNVKTLFLYSVAVNGILNLLWPSMKCGDKLLWIGNNSGIFLVKDCYNISQSFVGKG